MAILIWPASLPIAARFSPGPAIVSDVLPTSIGAMEDVLHRWAKRSCTLEWENLTNQDFARLDAMVDYLGHRRGTVKVPWMSYQAMIGGGTGTVSTNGAHTAGDTTISTTGWGGANPVVDFGDFIQINDGTPRLYRVMAAANRSGAVATITIEPGLWTDVGTANAVRHLRSLDTGNPLAYLVCTMRLADPSQVQGQVFPSPQPSYGRGIILSFVEAIRESY